MKKYRKKPIIIEAKQFFWREVEPDFRGDIKDSPVYFESNKYYINTLEGRMEVSDGDWIIKGVKGEFYPCKPDIFAMSYDEVKDKMDILL